MSHCPQFGICLAMLSKARLLHPNSIARFHQCQLSLKMIKKKKVTLKNSPTFSLKLVEVSVLIHFKKSSRLSFLFYLSLLSVIAVSMILCTTFWFSSNSYGTPFLNMSKSMPSRYNSGFLSSSYLFCMAVYQIIDRNLEK